MKAAGQTTAPAEQRRGGAVMHRKRLISCGPHGRMGRPALLSNLAVALTVADGKADGAHLRTLHVNDINLTLAVLERMIRLAYGQFQERVGLLEGYAAAPSKTIWLKFSPSARLENLARKYTRETCCLPSQSSPSPFCATTMADHWR